MPLTKPYIGWFSAGDLVYGLANTRSKLVLKLGTQIMEKAEGIATVDQYRKSSMNNDTYKDQWLEFLRANRNHAKHGRYMTAISGYKYNEEKFANAAVTKEALRNATWRAKSKFGMEWTLNGRGSIHFVLDEIDMGAVTLKTHKYVDPKSKTVKARDFPRGKAKPGDNKKERTITHAELRWIYRNRGNPLVQKGVQFWISFGKDIRPCGPPWDEAKKTTNLASGKQVTWKDAWKMYKPTITRSAF